MKALVLESLLQFYENVTLTKVFSCCEIFKNNYFEEHLPAAASKVIVWNCIFAQLLSKQF